jgi:hypothetical protein
MEIKIDFSHKIITNKLDANFPFVIVQRIMESCGWKYYDCDTTPSIERIKRTLYSLIKDSKSGISLGAGGFGVEFKDNNYNIIFTVGTFFYSKKSTEWVDEDLSYLDSFIGRVQVSEIIVGTPIQYLREFEKVAFFKRRCDNFIDSGKDYDYDKKLGLLFTKESYEDEGEVLYELRFIGVDRDYKI